MGSNFTGPDYLLFSGHSVPCSGFTTTGAAATKLSLIAAPAAGLSIYVTDIVVCTGTSVGSLTLMNDATTTGAFMAISLVANSTFHHTFTEPFKLSAAKPLGYTTTQTVMSVHASGFVAA